MSQTLSHLKPARKTRKPAPGTILKQIFQENLKSLAPEEQAAIVQRLQEIRAARHALSSERATLLQKIGVSPQSETETLLLLLENAKRIGADRERIREQSCTAEALGHLLGHSKQWVHSRYKSGKFIALREGDRLYFPLWQIDREQHDFLLPGLKATWEALELSDLAKILWLTNPSAYLEEHTPLELLREGKHEMVVSEAKSVGRIG